MTMRHNIILAQVLFFCCLIGLCHTASAGTPMSDRVAVDAGVKAEIAKDLASPYSPHESLSGRTCLDGRPVDGFQGDIVELWSNLECPFCGIQEPLQAQRDNPGLCIVVRHIPSDEYGESLKKALSYEALKTFSVNAAHRFWDAVLPKTSLGIPVPYEAALQTAIQEAAIAPDASRASHPRRHGFSAASASPPVISRRKNFPRLWNWLARPALETCGQKTKFRKS